MSLRSALSALTRAGPAPRPRVVAGTVREVEAYGPMPLQRGEWWLPPGPVPGARPKAGPRGRVSGGRVVREPGPEPGSRGRVPAVVLLHGGYWRPGYDRSLQDAVAADLCGRGWVVWNVDYRAADAPWPATLLDVATAYDHLARGRYADRVDPARVAVVGHSAGGCLALWLASRHRLAAGAPGSGSTDPLPALAVGQAPVASLAAAARAGLGGGAVANLLGGGPDQIPHRYQIADPLALLPTGVPTVLLHGARDRLVPLAQSTAYAAAAGCGLVRVPGGHFAHLDPATAAVAELRRALGDLASR